MSICINEQMDGQMDTGGQGEGKKGRGNRRTRRNVPDWYSTCRLLEELDACSKSKSPTSPSSDRTQQHSTYRPYSGSSARSRNSSSTSFAATNQSSHSHISLCRVVLTDFKLYQFSYENVCAGNPMYNISREIIP